MSTYHSPRDGDWREVEVRGAKMLKRTVFEGGYDLRSAYFRMDAGCRIPPHDHSKWVQVLVLEGRMQVEQDGAPTRTMGPGEVYFIAAGETHVETAVEPTLLLVTQGEDRPGWGANPPA